MSDLEQQTDEEFFACHEALIEELRGKHERIAFFRASGFQELIAVVSPSNPKVYHAFLNQLSKDTSDKAGELLKFALACVASPDYPTAKTIFNKQPGLFSKVAARAQDLAGGDAKELGKD